MKKPMFFVGLSFLSISFLFADSTPNAEVIIVGGGIAGAFEAYYAYQDAQKTGTNIRVTVYEKGQSFEQPALSGKASTNTAFNIFPSLTTDEILSVVPRGSELVEKLAIRFSDPGGIRIDDVPGVNESEAAANFIKAVALYGDDENHDDRTQTLLMLGKRSMNLWQEIYDGASDELRAILEQSNYNPCRDPQQEERVLHDGYRIDLLYGVPHAEQRAEGMRDTYRQLGYQDCKILSPDEVMSIDPFLTDFCLSHSHELSWNKDSVALWRPGGCIDGRSFLPKFYSYLKRLMGTYTDEDGEEQDCFNLVFNTEVTGVEFNDGFDLCITALICSDESVIRGSAEECSYVFCPGEAVGTLSKLGFEEPAYAGFAGPSLWLDIPLTSDQRDDYQQFNHCMEVHKVGIVLAWQARLKEDRISIGVAGTKAFYGDQVPALDEDFAKNRHLVQLNMINDVLPEFVSLACGYDTQGKHLHSGDMKLLKEKGILGCWVGRRAVAYDGFPTLGQLYCDGILVSNARCTTHLGSGGASFAPAAVVASRSRSRDALTDKVLRYADSRRSPVRELVSQ